MSSEFVWVIGGGNDLAWRLSVCAEVEHYPSAAGLDALDVVARVLDKTSPQQAMAVVYVNGDPAVARLAKELRAKLKTVVAINHEPVDSVPAVLPADATPDEVAAALDLRYAAPVPSAPVPPEAPAVPAAPVPSAPVPPEAPAVPAAPVPSALPRPPWLSQPSTVPAPAPAAPPRPVPPVEVLPAVGAGPPERSVLDDPSFAGSPWADQAQAEVPGAARGTVIVVASGKGGVGKSTLSMWITEALHHLGRKTVLVDANIGQSDLAKMGQVWSLGDGMASLMSAPRFSTQELLDACVDVEGLGQLLPAPRESALMDVERALATLRRAIGVLAGIQEFVIVDGPVGTPIEPIYQDALLKPGVADKLLLVMTAHEPTLQDCYNWLRAVTQSPARGGAGWPMEQTIAVLNRFDAGDGLAESKIRDWFVGIHLCDHIPRVDATQAINRGRWRCPERAAPAVLSLVQTLTGVVIPGAMPDKSTKKGSLGLRGLFKKR